MQIIKNKKNDVVFYCFQIIYYPYEGTFFKRSVAKEYRENIAQKSRLDFCAFHFGYFSFF